MIDLKILLHNDNEKKLLKFITLCDIYNICYLFI